MKKRCKEIFISFLCVCIFAAGLSLAFNFNNAAIVEAADFIYGDEQNVESEYDYNILDDGEDGAIRIDGLKYQHHGALEIPSNINGMTVIEINSNAFNFQNDITSVKIPNTVTSIGEYAFAYLPNLQNVIFEEGSTLSEIKNGVFANCKSLTEINLPESVVKIGNSAFENCGSLVNINSLDNVKVIGNKAFKGCSSLENINLPSELTVIGEQAFNRCYNLNITVSSDNLNFSADNNILYNKDKTVLIAACKISLSIEILKTVEEIKDYAFEGNNNLFQVRFKHTPKIGAYAFANCVNLSYIYFDVYDVPVMEEKSFANNNFILFTMYDAQSKFREIFAEYTSNIFSKSFNVVFISDNQVIETRNVYNGSVIQNLPVLNRPGYTFAGWYSDPYFEGKLYQNGQYWESEVNIELYAKWEPEKYTITLNPNGGILQGSNTITVMLGETFKINTKATKEGHTLEGWYDNNNVKYITASGESARPWDITSDITLFAHWIVEKYEIQINDNGSITWLGPNGLSKERCMIEYGTIINNYKLITEFKNSEQGFKEGKIFDRFEYEGSIFDWQVVPDIGEDGALITIFPIWILEEHTIYFHTQCDVIINPVIAQYGIDIVLPNVERAGYIFNGWYLNVNDEQNIAWTKMPDLTPSSQNNGSIILYAKWTPITYYIYYEPNGGSGSMNYSTHTYDVMQKLSSNKFSRTGHVFLGWATSPNGSVVYANGENVLNLTTKPNDKIVLYAVWRPQTFKIICLNAMPNMLIIPSEYTYGEGLSSMPKLYTKVAYGYKEVTLYGWYREYKDKEFKNQVYSISKTSIGDVQFYAKYDYNATSASAYDLKITGINEFKQPYLEVPLTLACNSYKSKICYYCKAL